MSRPVDHERSRFLGAAGTTIAVVRLGVLINGQRPRRYASTGGWGFAQFDDGKPADEAVHRTCFACHEPAEERDFVFTRYAP